MATPKKPLNTSTKKINDDEDDDFDDEDPKPGKKVADDDDDFDEDTPLDDDLVGFDTGYDPYDDEEDD